MNRLEFILKVVAEKPKSKPIDVCTSDILDPSNKDFSITKGIIVRYDSVEVTQRYDTNTTDITIAIQPVYSLDYISIRYVLSNEVFA